MKTADLIGFAAILAAGTYTGYNVRSCNSIISFDLTALTFTDYAIIIGLLIVGFYFAVILS